MDKLFIGKNLRFARQARNISRKVLGEQIEQPSSYIHQLELNHFAPTIPEKRTLASCLGVTREFFSLPYFMLEGQDFTNYVEQRIDKRTQQHLSAQAVIVNHLVALFDSELEFPKLDLPEIDTKQLDGFHYVNEVEDIAEQARKYWKLGTCGHPRLMAGIENGGIPIVGVDNPKIDFEACSVLLQRPIFMVSLNQPVHKQRFQVAYLLGRLLMHLGGEKVEYKEKHQAVQFAYAFLIPRVAFCYEFKKGWRLDWKHIAELEQRWKVSKKMILHRAKHFGMINTLQYRTSLKKAERLGESELEKDQPDLITLAIRAMWKFCGRTVDDLADDLSVSRNFLEKIIGHHIGRLKGEVTDLGQFKDQNVVRLEHFRRKKESSC